MRRPFPPAVEADLERAHEVFAGENGMLLVPHDALAEVQLVLLQERRVIAEVGVPAPDVESATRIQHACHVPEPGVEQHVELSSVTKSLASGRSLARIFLCVGFAFSGSTLQVELLMVLVRVGEAAVAGGDGVIASRLNFHVVRRVRVDQMDSGPSSRRSRSAGLLLSPQSKR